VLRVYYLMRYVKSDPTGRDVHLSLPAPCSVDRAYHEILGVVKRNAPTATSWGRGKTDGIEEMTIYKLLYHFDGSLGNVRQESLVKEEVVKHWH
jgi:hypothetical protein